MTGAGAAAIAAVAANWQAGHPSGAWPPYGKSRPESDSREGTGGDANPPASESCECNNGRKNNAAAYTATAEMLKPRFTRRMIVDSPPAHK
jgi:hypothetical protein